MRFEGAKNVGIDRVCLQELYVGVLVLANTAYDIRCGMVGDRKE